MSNRLLSEIVVLLVLAAACLAPAPARGADDEECFRCHGRPGLYARQDEVTRSLAVSPTFFEASIHSLVNCRECHSDIAAIPHPDAQRSVSCGQECHQQGQTGDPYSHESLYWEYSSSVHGEAEEGGISCMICHPAASFAELIRRDLRHEAIECASCHRENGHVASYFSGIHYFSLAAGSKRAPSCPDCHTSHRVLAADNEDSTVHRKQLAPTCGRGAIASSPGRCHEGVAEASLASASMNVLAMPARAPNAVDWGFAFVYWIALLGLVLQAGISLVKGR